MGISLEAKAELRHLNIRKQGDDSEAILAIDAKLQAEIDTRVLAPALGVETEQEVVDSLYRYNPTAGEYELRLLGVDEIKSWATYANHDLLIAGLHQTKCDVKKIVIKPSHALRATVIFQATIAEPSSALVNMLANQVSEEIKIAIDAPPELDFSGGQEQGEAETLTEAEPVRAAE